MSKEPKKGPKPYTTGRKPKVSKELEAIIANQKVMLETIGKQSDVLKGQDTRIKTLEDNIGSIVSALQERPAQAGPQVQGSATGNPVADAIMGKVMSGGESPMKVAVTLAKEFNKTYISGQANMLRMMGLLVKGKKIEDLFGGEEVESEE